MPIEQQFLAVLLVEPLIKEQYIMVRTSLSIKEWVEHMSTSVMAQIPPMTKWHTHLQQSSTIHFV